MKKKRKSMPPLKQTTVQQRSSRAYAAGAWIMIPRAFIHVLPPQMALLLSFLADAAYKFTSSPITWTPDDLPKEDGWFMCEVARSCAALNISTATYHRLFKEFTSRKIIQTARRGFDNRYYLRIDWALIERLIDQWERDENRSRFL